MIRILDGHYVYDGAGVKIFRVFSHDTVDLTDPFLLLDHFGSDDPKDYIKGFPWHPHRGIETVTYMNKGNVEHQDNIGHKGIIGSGDIQWMSAGSGIIHQEMPKGLLGMDGFQLWVNMPSKKKMIDPEYRGIEKNDIRIVKKNGCEIKIISGKYDEIKGPVKHLVIDVDYFDITMDDNKTFNYKPKKGHTTLCYVVSGKGKFLTDDINAKQLIILRDVDKILVKSEDKMRFLVISGKPLKETIAWGGPIVMNTQEELRVAFEEINNGTFIKTRNLKS